MDNQQPNTQTAPSLEKVVCPHCGQGNFSVLGSKGSKGSAVALGMTLGVIGNLIADSNNKTNFQLQPIQYKCNSCKKKFEALPLYAEPEDFLEEPCTIEFSRLSSFVGMAVSQSIYLNGVKIGTIGNGKTITFQTPVKHNLLFVTDQYGVAFKGDYRFEAQSGGKCVIRYKRKFLK